MTPRDVERIDLSPSDEEFVREREFAAKARLDSTPMCDADIILASADQHAHPDDGTWGEDGLTRKGCEFVYAMKLLAWTVLAGIVVLGVAAIVHGLVTS